MAKTTNPIPLTTPSHRTRLSHGPASRFAPATHSRGSYEIRYATDRVKGITFKSIPIIVN